VAFRRKNSRLALAALGALVAAAPLACGGAVRRFPAKEPMWRDADERPFAPAPREYVSPFAWDGANQMVFRPMSRFFAVDPAGRATNVNAFDEVPDSSWFQNRIGKTPMTPEQIARGACDDKVLDTAAADGTWIIDQGKPNGFNPGFRVNIPGIGKFMLKADPLTEPDRATGATTVAARLYHAAGYYSPCDSVVYFRPSILKLRPGLTVTDNSGVSKPFDDAALEKLLESASHRNGLVRMVASKWLPGKPLGPYRYDGTREDDPNDVIPHEDRRELRGGRVLAAWLNHFDSREQNTMDVFMAADKEKKDGPGYVRHYILDLGDCFGSVWNWDEISRRLGFAYYLDIPYLAEDFVTFGVNERPWERARRDGGIFNYFSARDFDPDLWRGGYPNPAFVRMTEDDAAWMARIVARFTDEALAAAVGTAKYDAPSERYLTATLALRRDVILRRYLTRLSPLADVHVQGDELCAVDLARSAHVVADDVRAYGARFYAGKDGSPVTAITPSGRPEGRVCVKLPRVGPSGAPDDDPSRYGVVEIVTASASGPLRAHTVDLGPERGLLLVGLERPAKPTSPP
jgi:hypothetical protein